MKSDTSHTKQPEKRTYAVHDLMVSARLLRQAAESLELAAKSLEHAVKVASEIG